MKLSFLFILHSIILNPHIKLLFNFITINQYQKDHLFICVNSLQKIVAMQKHLIEVVRDSEFVDCLGLIFFVSRFTSAPVTLRLSSVVPHLDFSL